jgi:hypothetical protein
MEILEDSTFWSVVIVAVIVVAIAKLTFDHFKSTKP